MAQGDGELGVGEQQSGLADRFGDQQRVVVAVDGGEESVQAWPLGADREAVFVPAVPAGQHHLGDAGAVDVFLGDGGGQGRLVQYCVGCRSRGSRGTVRGVVGGGKGAFDLERARRHVCPPQLTLTGSEGFPRQGRYIPPGLVSRGTRPSACTTCGLIDSTSRPGRAPAESRIRPGPGPGPPPPAAPPPWTCKAAGNRRVARFSLPGCGPASGGLAGVRGCAGISGGERRNGCFRLGVYRHPGVCSGVVGVCRWGAAGREMASTRQPCRFLPPVPGTVRGPGAALLYSPALVGQRLSRPG